MRNGITKFPLVSHIVKKRNKKHPMLDKTSQKDDAIFLTSYQPNDIYQNNRGSK